MSLDQAHILPTGLRRRATKALGALLAAHLLLSALSVGGLMLRGEPAFEAFSATAPSYGARFLLGVSQDSWRAILHAYLESERGENVDYYATAAANAIKFQYPPSSLALFDLVPDKRRTFEELGRGAPLNTVLSWLGRLAVVASIFLTVAVLHLGLTRASGEPSARDATRLPTLTLLTAMLAFTSHPLMAAYTLGQVQVFLNAAIALALLLYFLERRLAAGICIGLCCLIKPQYAVILLWAALRKDWRFAVGLSAVAAVGGVLALVRFGLSDHLRYLELLRTIAQRGEAFWMNQSMNGLVNFLVGNGDPREFDVFDYAPYRPLVHAATFLSSAVILGLALWPLKTSTRPGAVELSLVILASTMASPIAWEHHYGAIFPVFAIAFAAALNLERPGWFLWALGASYLLTAFTLQRPELLFASTWSGLLAYHLLFGSVTLFGLLLLLLRIRSIHAVHGNPAAAS